MNACWLNSARPAPDINSRPPGRHNDYTENSMEKPTHMHTMKNPNQAARRLAAATINAIAIAGGLWLLLAVFAAGFKFY